MKLNARTMTENGRDRLVALAADEDEVTARRAQVALMTQAGHDVDHIAQTLGVSERTVRRAVEMYNDCGAKGLKRRGLPGRRRLIDQSGQEALISLIRRSPQEFGIAAQRWSPADLAVVAKREGTLGELSIWTLRRELARITRLAPELRERLDLPDQFRPGAPRGNHNARRHGVYARGEISDEDRVLMAEAEACLRHTYPGACDTEPELIRAAATASLLLTRAWSVKNMEAAERMDGRLRNAIRAMKAAEESRRRTTDANKRTPADWAADLLRRCGNK